MVDVKTRPDEVQVAPESPIPAATSTAPAPEMPPTAVAFAGKAKDLAALRDTVVDAANVGAGLWFSYLFVLVYLIVAVGGVTHRNLLFESPVRLPFLGVDLPLVGFFVLGPALFLIVHAYVLLHFTMLADKVGVFHAELQAQIADENVRARLRRQLPSNIFVQFLAGPIEVRSGLMGTLLRLIAQISLVAGPLALLVFFQLQFLPYHNEAVSWWQRIAVVIDLALLWALWPSLARGERSSVVWGDLHRPHVAAAALASVLPILLVFTIATFPGELLNGNPVPGPPILPQFDSKSIRWVTPYEFLVAGDIDLVAAKPRSVWSNRLVLPGLELKPGDSVSLRGRNLDGAVLLGARLQKVDFMATLLRGAVLNGADLREARFSCTDTRLRIGADSSNTADEKCPQLQNAFLVGARLEGTELQNAQMQGAILDKAELRGVNLEHAHLEGASLHKADLHGASLAGAELEGASLDDANLYGASLVDAKLLGAHLRSTHLQGAVLDRAELQGAYLHDTHLEGASLVASRLHGASLRGAHLEGAFLNQAQLHGAELDSASVRGASFQRAVIWRASARSLNGNPMMVASDPGPMRPRVPQRARGHTEESDCFGNSPCDWTADQFARLKQSVLDQLPNSPDREETLKRIAVLDPDTPLDDAEGRAAVWIRYSESSPSADDFNNSLKDVLQTTGCAADGAPYVVHSWLESKRLSGDNPAVRALSTALLDEASCAGARALSAEDKAKLTAMRDGASR